MSIKEITLTRRLVISSPDSANEIRVNIDNYIGAEELGRLIAALGIDETFNVEVTELDDDAEIVCLGCGDTISESELADNGQYCSFCAGDSDDEESG